eukprot:4797466-Amphidinium_carterae.1
MLGLFCCCTEASVGRAMHLHSRPCTMQPNVLHSGLVRLSRYRCAQADMEVFPPPVRLHVNLNNKVAT